MSRLSTESIMLMLGIGTVFILGIFATALHYSFSDELHTAAIYGRFCITDIVVKERVVKCYKVTEEIL